MSVEDAACLVLTRLTEPGSDGTALSTSRMRAWLAWAGQACDPALDTPLPWSGCPPRLSSVVWTSLVLSLATGCLPRLALASASRVHVSRATRQESTLAALRKAVACTVYRCLQTANVATQDRVLLSDCIGVTRYVLRCVDVRQRARARRVAASARWAGAQQAVQRLQGWFAWALLRFGGMDLAKERWLQLHSLELLPIGATHMLSPGEYEDHVLGHAREPHARLMEHFGQLNGAPPATAAGWQRALRHADGDLLLLGLLDLTLREGTLLHQDVLFLVHTPVATLRSRLLSPHAERPCVVRTHRGWLAVTPGGWYRERQLAPALVWWLRATSLQRRGPPTGGAQWSQDTLDMRAHVIAGAAHPCADSASEQRV